MIDPIEIFMRESNWIEGERDEQGIGLLHPNDLKAAKKFLSKRLTEDSLLELHLALSEGRDILRGDYRRCNVIVGSSTPPGWPHVPHLMSNFFLDIDKWTPWEAHCRFEKIHPFEDLNGRTGRLVWLHKMKGKTSMPFLQAFYYQTLSQFK